MALRTSKSRQRYHTPSHAHAPKQEERSAVLLGGKVVKGSGSGDERGDVRVKDVSRIEHKCTKHKSFSVTLEMLSKIDNAAAASGEVPVIEIDFLGDHGKLVASVVVMPTWALHDLIDRAGGNGNS